MVPKPLFKAHTSASILASVFGRPGPRRDLPSYFSAINLRCQANNVSGVTIVATAASTLRPSGTSPCWLTGAADRHSIAAVGRRAVLEGFDFLRAGNR
jgi:hypothetical protein